MADKKISALTPNTSPTGSEEFVYAYNNSNGKITLDTMKTFASADSQPTLVSGTNIKTINNQSILGSGDITIQGGGQDTYDAIVDASGNGDYTNVKDALDAGKLRIFVKNGTYNHTNERWEADTTEKKGVLIEGESRQGVIVNFSSTSNISNSDRSFIETRVSDSYSSVLIKNITFNLAPAGGNDGQSGPYNSLFKSYSSLGESATFRVEHCNIYIDASQGGACVCDAMNMSVNYSGGMFTINDTPSNGLFDCYIEIKSGSTYNVGLTRQPYYDSGSTYNGNFVNCNIDCNGTGVLGLWNGRYTQCYINCGDAGVQSIRLYNSYVQCNNIYKDISAQAIGGDNYTRVDISELKFSSFDASTTVNPADRVNVGDCVGSMVAISVDSNTLKVYQDGIWETTFFSLNDCSVRIQGESVGCEISSNAIDMYGTNKLTNCEIGYSTAGVHTQSSGQCILSGCNIVGNWTFSGETDYSDFGCTISGCRFSGSGQDVVLDGEGIVFTGNTQNNLHLSLGANATKCVVSGSFVNSFEIVSGAANCVVVGNRFNSSIHSAGTNITYANNSD